MDKKGLGFLLLAVLLIVSAMVFLPAVQDTAQAQSATTINVSGEVSGWLWSTGVGWIKLASNPTEPVEIVDNSLKGYGWSNSVGWINFNPSDVPTDFPVFVDYPRHSVKIKTIGENGPEYPVIGYARACSVFANGCSGPLKSSAELGGWDGWIRMENTKYDIDSYVFSGDAWGNLNLAWVGFYAGTPDIDIDLCKEPNPPAYCDDISRCIPTRDNDYCDGGGGEDEDVSCSASPDFATINQNVTFTASPVSTGYTYDWGGNVGTVTPSPSSHFFVTTYNSADLDNPIQNVDVEVKDADGELIGQANCKTSLEDGIPICPPDLPIWDIEEQACVSVATPCTFSLDDSALIRLNFNLDSTEEETSSAANSAILTPNNCDDGLDLSFTKENGGSIPDWLEMVCSKDNGSTWDAAYCSDVVSPILVGVRAKRSEVLGSDLTRNCLLISINGSGDMGVVYACFSNFIET